MRADAFGTAAVTRLACATRAPFAAPWRRHRRRAGQHRRGRDQALARRATRQATAGIEPAAAWQSLRGELLAQFNITGCCTRCRQSLASSLRVGTARNPRYVLRPAAPAAPAAEARAARSTGLQFTRSGAASGAVMVLAPAHPPSAPRGGSLALSTVLLSVAPCSPRQGFASPLRALDPAARGAP